MTQAPDFRYASLTIKVFPPGYADQENPDPKNDLWCPFSTCTMDSTCGPPTTLCDGGSVLMMEAPMTSRQLEDLLTQLKSLIREANVVLTSQDRTHFDDVVGTMRSLTKS